MWLAVFFFEHLYLPCTRLGTSQPWLCYPLTPVLLLFRWPCLAHRHQIPAGATALQHLDVHFATPCVTEYNHCDRRYAHSPRDRLEDRRLRNSRSPPLGQVAFL